MWSVDSVLASLRGRLAFSLSAGALLVLTVSFAALHSLIRGELYAHLDRELDLQMGAVTAYAVAHPGEESIAAFMPRFGADTHQDYFQIWDSHGTVLARSDSNAGRDLPRLDAVSDGPTYYDVILPDGHHGRAVAQVFVLPPGDSRVALTVLTAEETERIESLENRVHLTLFAVALATVAALLVIMKFSVERGLKPVADFARSLEGVDPDDPDARLDTGPLPSELRPVATSFSTLLNRLLDALARERRYARNVAHELRNPLAEIRLLADVGAASEDPAACQVAIGDIQIAAAGMERIVDTLMALTRYEAGLELPQPEPVNLVAELRREVHRLAHPAEQRGLSISLDLPDEAWVYTDSALVHQLLSNLLGNAVSHSPAGTRVRVAMTANGDFLLANPAPHLTPADVPKLGERFYRVDSSAGHGSHAGLGLSLVGAIARVMGLTLTLTLHDDGTLVSQVRGFPPVERR